MHPILERVDDLDFYKKHTYIQTYTGKKVHFLEPDLSEIDIEDIAHSLSQMCRFAGHTKRFYSVAEHCVVVSNHSTAKNALWGLLHDASEAYIVDIPKPVKGFLLNYEDLEKTVMDAICEKFGLSKEIPSEIKTLDGRILFTEKEQLLSYADWGWSMPPLQTTLQCYNPSDAKELFLNRFKFLYEKK